MESGNARVVVEHLNACLTSLRDHQVDPALPADQYKVNDLARHLAILYMKRMLEPFNQFNPTEVKPHLQKNSLYYSHIPRVPPGI